MNFYILFVLVAFSAALPNDDYSRYENFDIKDIVGNIRLLASYAKCFLGTGKCTPESADIKKWIPDALKTKCGKCSEKQKILVARVIKALIEKLPEDFKKLNQLHNADGRYDEEISEFVKQYGS